jgi:hypothetical protein
MVALHEGDVDEEPSLRLEHAPGLGERPLRVPHVLEHGHEHHSGAGPVRDRKALGHADDVHPRPRLDLEIEDVRPVVRAPGADIEDGPLPRE